MSQLFCYLFTVFQTDDMDVYDDETTLELKPTVHLRDLCLSNISVRRYLGDVAAD